MNNSVIQEIERRGLKNVKVENAFKGTIIDRIDLCQLLLSEGRLLFTEKVPNLKAAFQSALWDTTRAKSKRYP
jgi:hypothetical protein